jgi:hypothetical protein
MPFSGTTSPSAEGTAKPLYSFDRPGTTRETFIRGSLFVPLPAFMKTYLGPEGWVDFLQRVDPVASAVLSREFVALAWYPFKVVTSAVDVLLTTGKMLGKANAVRDMTTFNLNQATRGIFRAVFKLGSPEFMIARSDQVWRKFYSTGQMTTRLLTQKEAVVRLEYVPDMTTNYSLVVLHSLESVIVKAGGRITVCETTSDLGRGDKYSEYHYCWT